MTYADMDAIKRIGIEAMTNDQHTQLKAMGDVPYLKEEPLNDSFRETLQNKRYVFLVAANEEGEVVGGSSFYFQGFEQEDIPYTDPSTEEEKPNQDQPKSPKSEKKSRLLQNKRGPMR